MKAVLISIQPKWCELITSGKKTVEVRKTKPKLELPFKCYIYCTNDKKCSFCIDDGNKYTYIGNGKVIGEFVCDYIVTAEHGRYKVLKYYDTWVESLDLCCYADGKTVYGWHISDLVIYEKPKDLIEFEGLRKTKFGYEPIKITRPPQSWCYVEEATP